MAEPEGSAGSAATDRQMPSQPGNMPPGGILIHFRTAYWTEVS
jgi:hypothetical protein